MSDGSGILCYSADGTYVGRLNSVAFGETFHVVESGGITVDSRPGMGSTFRIRLPLAGPPEAPHA